MLKICVTAQFLQELNYLVNLEDHFPVYSFIFQTIFLFFYLFLMQWKEAKPEELMDSKLRCVFEMPNENGKMVTVLYFYSRTKNVLSLW